MDAQTTAALEGGFSDVPRDSAAAFRGLMLAMARPGRIEPIDGASPPAPLSVAAGTVLLTLTGPDTSLYLAGSADSPDVKAWVAFHTGAPLTSPGEASFAVGRWEDLVPLDQYPMGTPEYPDRSTTLIIECDDLVPEGTRLTGPGIRGEASLPLPERDAFARNRAGFPLGVDFYFTCGNRVAGLPRSTRIG